MENFCGTETCCDAFKGGTGFKSNRGVEVGLGIGVDDCVGDGVADAVGLGELEGDGVADAVGLGVLEGDGVIEALGEGDGEAEGEGLGVVPPPPRLGSGTPLTGVNKPTNKVMDRAAPII